MLPACTWWPLAEPKNHQHLQTSSAAFKFSISTPYINKSDACAFSTPSSGHSGPGPQSSPDASPKRSRASAKHDVIDVMAQFVTHIQPTLVEASHHHVPHHHHHHKALHQQHHHRESHQDLAKEAAGGSYLDSHGLSHAYQLKFVDAQGVHRDYHGHGMDKSPLGEEVHHQHQGRPVPPKYIDVQPVYPENKAVSGWDPLVIIFSISRTIKAIQLVFNMQWLRCIHGFLL